mgnify:CR=1 FL=1
MTDAEFDALAGTTLQRLEQALDSCDADLDYEVQPGGVLELEFADGSKIIVNRHGSAREIWVAARSGGFHYRPEGSGEALRWVNTRDGEELFAALSRLASQQAGEPITLG